METPVIDQFPGEEQNMPIRPDFLKIICILSFVACGLMILITALGTAVLALSDAKIEEVWFKAIESNPQLEEFNAITIMHSFGMWCVYTLLANIFSLIGVIMMWRLEKIGFFVYVAAELITHFFTIETGSQKEQSSGGIIFSVLIDLIFIAMYFANFKYMNNKNNNTFVQSGT